MAGRIMAIAAHPGDGVFTMGAAIAQHVASGGSGVLVSLSAGERGAPKGVAVHEYGERQRVAAEKAMRVLGGASIVLPYADAEIPFTDESAKAVCDVIRDERPDVVVTHWSGSGHKDHQNCHLIAHDAIFYAALATLERKHPPHAARRLYYAENWEDMKDFQPDVYLDIDGVYGKWVEACELFPMWRGETGFRYNDYYTSLAVMRGCLSGFRRAVALMSDAEQRTRRVGSL